VWRESVTFTEFYQYYVQLQIPLLMITWYNISRHTHLWSLPNHIMHVAMWQQWWSQFGNYKYCTSMKESICSCTLSTNLHFNIKLHMECIRHIHYSTGFVTYSTYSALLFSVTGILRPSGFRSTSVIWKNNSCNILPLKISDLAKQGKL